MGSFAGEFVRSTADKIIERSLVPLNLEIFLTEFNGGKQVQLKSTSQAHQ
jgi:hypothetical protein